MSEKIMYECIDAGSEYCPCYLAETNDCITCSHLQGKSFCDCNWRGVCIYQEYVWNNKKAKETRKSFNGKILEKKFIGKNLIIFKIAVLKTLARQLKQPGSYVFVRNPDKSEYFDVPMSVMYSDENTGEIHIAVQIIGSKTKSLIDLEDEIIVRGPYWNGLFGIKALKTTLNSNTLVVARGVALAPAVLVSKYLVKNNNKVTLILDRGKLEEIFIYEYLNKLNVIVIESDITSESGKILIEELLKNNKYELCYSGGSERQHKEINKLLLKFSPKTKYVISNNKKICCGEGICGSCAVKIGENIIKTCKAQIDSAYIVKKGEENR
ncbi:sulfide/dihydroorotate dehydrogenase-like FAD/NAD-binding protein [Caminicella sporogenes]|uniref:sulfide/dihydroorotate dehydrogenase-like FAD/NAD-binding protein n=1 Tax=Caminicella sporogenes TaxID=166485 RepID=UPI0025404D55|nr:sulfide/dihydroorotate dehydrogenase-like FAD/NAD-binding protein [Caminicella sporogenes]WIF94729.1 sulfide/dihydroorotate dehydrogenase-like FAD/NAD-binding protein [Caminicella sporogenes]